MPTVGQLGWNGGENQRLARGHWRVVHVGVATLLVERIFALDEVGWVAQLALDVLAGVRHADSVNSARAEVIVAEFATALDQCRPERTVAREARPGRVSAEPAIALVDPRVLDRLDNLCDFVFRASVFLDGALYAILRVRERARHIVRQLCLASLLAVVHHCLRKLYARRLHLLVMNV